jgi:peptidoglycan/LPS O-acetylase OafA/YrhL
MAPPASPPTLELRFPSVGKGRLESIDELKGLAILLVIFYHAGGVLIWQNFMHGDVGVDLFVILSGVGLALSKRVESLGRFFGRRLLRIFPAYWVALTLFLILNQVFLQLHYTAFDVVVHYLGIHGWFGDAIGLGVNDSFWFVTLIVNVYLLYGLVIRRLLDRADLVILWAALVSIPIAYAYFETGQSGCFGHIALRMPGFFAGVLLGVLLREGRLSVPLTPSFAVGLGLLFYVPYTHGIIFYSEFVALGLAVAYVYFWKPKVSPSVVDPTSRLLRFFGTYSLEIFLLHQPFLRNYNYYVLGRFFHEPSPPVSSLIAGMAVGLVVALVLSVALHQIIGRLVGPFLARSKPALAAV